MSRGAVLAILRRQARRADPGRRPGHHRRLHRRAGARHRRHRAAAEGLLGEDPGGACTNTTSCSSPTRSSPASAASARMFGSDHYGMKPDLITIAKGLTSAYAPLSGVIVSDKVWQVLEQGSDELRPDRPWLDLFGAPALRRGGRRQSRTGRRARPRRAMPATTGAYFQHALNDAVAVQSLSSARCAARACWPPSSSCATATTASSSIRPRRSGLRIAAALLERGVIGRAMPQGRHPRLRAAALPDAGRGRYDRRRHEGRRGSRDGHSLMHQLGTGR